MADTHNNVRLPPDSTGKRLRHAAKWIVNYDNGTTLLTQGDNVTLTSSSLTGTVDDVVGNASSGWFGLIMSETSVGTPIDGENIQLGGVTYCTVNGTPTEQYFYPVNLLASGTTPGNQVEVDRYGSLYMRTEQGPLQLASGGRLKTADEIALGVYDLSVFTLPEIISTDTAGDGAQTHDSTYGANKYSVGTASGNLIQRRSDVYHIAQPNYPITFGTLLQCGDEGKDGLRRRWGIYDDDNGFFFELDDDVLYAVHRSNNSGTVVDERHAQADWNQDRLNGEGGVRNKTGVTLDVSKINYYWIAFGPSTCTVVWGVRLNSRHVVCHEDCWTNIDTRPVVKNWTLPVTWAMDTTAVVSSTSEMYVVFGMVTSDISAFNVPKNPRSFNIGPTNVSTDWTPIASVRARQYIQGIPGYDNRAWIIPHKLTLLASDQAIAYRVKNGNTLDGDTFTAETTTFSEIDTDSTSSTGGIVIYSGVAGSGQSKDDIIVSSSEVTALTTKITRRADLTEEPLHFTLEAKALTGSTDVYISVIQYEVL